MDKQKSLRIINVALFLLVLGLVISALSHDFIPHEIFEKAHPLTGFTLVILVIFHLILNWPWVKSNYFKKKGN